MSTTPPAPLTPEGIVKFLRIQSISPFLTADEADTQAAQLIRQHVAEQTKDLRVKLRAVELALWKCEVSIDSFLGSCSPKEIKDSFSYMATASKAAAKARAEIEAKDKKESEGKRG